MPHRHCKTCGSPLHAEDTHAECVSVTLTHSFCWCCAQRDWPRPLPPSSSRSARLRADEELTDLRSLVRGGVWPAHQLPRNSSSVPCLSILPARHTGISPGRPRLEATLHADKWPSCVGSDQFALTEGDACAGQDEPRSRHVVKEQRLLRGMDAPPARGSENLGSLWQSSSRPLRLQRQLSLPNLFYIEHGCPGPQVALFSALCFPSNRSATAGTQASQGATAQAYSNSPPLEEPAVGVGSIPAARSSPVADTLEMAPPLSSERYAMASTARAMGAFRPPRACVKHNGRS